MPQFLKKQKYILAALICCLAIAASNCFSQEPSDLITTKGGWEIFADTISFDPQTGRYRAAGNVEIIQGVKKLTADLVILDNKKNIAEASGNVTLVSGNDTMSGSRLEMDMNKGTGTLYEGFVFIRENHFRIRGRRIEKTGEASYRIQEARLTTCDGENPDWQITGGNVDVTIEGYGYVSHASFKVKQLPVLYVPWLIFPVKLQRQTGLLAPQASFSSRNGIEYIQPFYWAVSDHMDATFYYHHIQNRGEKLGAEYRYALSQNSKGIIMADGFKDRKTDDGTPEATDKWGYSADTAPRPNDDRYWVRAKLDQQLPGQAMARLDLDIVSDQDYLREFSDGYTGYNSTENIFMSGFGRDIDDENNPVRTNRLNINRIWNRHVLNTDLVWYDDVIKRRQSHENDTLQRLPRIGYNALKQPVGKISAINGATVFGSMDGEYNYFFRQDGQTGHRIDMHPRIYFPLRIRETFTFEPSAGFRQTAWYLDGDKEDRNSDKRYAHREIYDLKAELSTDLHRIFSLSAGNVDKIKHVIIPMLSYGYIPGTDQSELPFFEENDRFEAENKIALSFTHLFTSRHTVAGTNGNPEHSYNQFCRFFVEQAYDFNQSHNPDLAFEPLYAELELNLKKSLSLRADASWSYERDGFETSNLSARYQSSRGDHLRLEYRNSRDFNQSLYIALQTPVSRSLTLLADYERNLKTDQDIEMGLGFRWQSQCWAVEAGYRKEEDDRKYTIMIDLYGLGAIGDSM
jgi:LPS-assembly protein